MPPAEPGREQRIAAHPDLTPAHVRLLKYYANPWRLGPFLSDELVALILHLYSDEEAEIAQHLRIGSARTADAVAKKARRPLEEAEAVLDRLADEKNLAISHATGIRPKTYRLVPLMPGAFEMILMSGKDDEWHRRFGQLYEAVFNTGYLQRLLLRPAPVARFIPVEETIDAIPMVIPSDRLTEIIMENSRFALGMCACRQARHFAGHGCEMPRETCLAVGNAAEFVIEKNLMRRVDRSEALDVKRRANAAGLANLTINVDPHNPNFICSCCGCCCVALRTITQFDTPGLVAPPHFLPVRDPALCTQCGTCIERCPTQTHQRTEDGWIFRQERCIGCGICVSSCPTGALRMEPAKHYRKPPPKDYYRFTMRLSLGILPAYYQRFLRKIKGKSRAK